MSSPCRRYNNTHIIDAGQAANRRRAHRIGQQQAQQAQLALAALDCQRYPRHAAVLRHRIAHPTASLRELAESIDPPMSRDALASLLRRALATPTGGDQ